MERERKKGGGRGFGGEHTYEVKNGGGHVTQLQQGEEVEGGGVSKKV